MASTFTLELRDAFLVRPEALKRICSLLSDRVGETKLNAECADQITREFADVISLTKYENSKSKRLLNLDLVARSEDWKKTAKVSFADKWYFGGIRVSIEAREDIVTRLRSDLLDVISGMRPWYWPINKIDFAVVPLLIFMFLWLAALVYSALRGSTEPSTSSPQGTAIAQLAMMGLLFSLVVGSFIADRFRSFMFPHGTFLIGQEIDRYDVLEKWRWGLGVAIFASLISGIALIWIT